MRAEALPLDAASRESIMGGMRTTKLFLAVLVPTLALLVGMAAADSLRPGMSLPQLTLSDQHDAKMKADANVRYVLFTRDMAAGDLVKDVLAEGGGERLAAARAIYVSDISRMPRLVTRLFAMPSMRKRGYRIFLDRDGTATAAFPSEEGKVTAIDTTEGTIVRIKMLGSADELRALLDAR